MKLLSVKQLAELTAIKSSTLYDWANQGRVPGVVRVNGLLRFNAAAVHAWLKTLEEKTSCNPPAQ